MAQMRPDLYPEPRSPEPQDGIREVLAQLELLTRRLKMTGLFSATFTALALSFIMFASFVPRFFLSTRDVGLELTLSGAVFTVCAILFLTQFDLLKKKGDILFKEVSDDLQWHVRYGEEDYQVSMPVPQARPDLRVRIVLREYVSSTRLPLLSSAENGPFRYAILNVAIFLTYAVVSVFFSAFFK